MSSAEDIAAIFQRDPLSLTDQDLDAIVAKFRAQRAFFNSGAPKSEAEGKATAEKKPKVKLTALDLGDLGI